MDTDVLVVGAGPTGLLLACELALAGVRVRIVERRTEPRRESRALTLHPRSVELLDLRGLAPRFLAGGRTAPGWHFAMLDTRLDFSALDSRHGYTLFLPQARTEDLLAERARELSVVIERGRRTTALEQDADGVTVRLDGPDGASGTVRARYAVGCDGGRSTVRGAVGIGFPGTDETLTGMLGDFAVYDTDPAVLDAARRGGVLVAPLDNGLTRFVRIDPERIRVPSTEPVTLEEFRASLVRACGTDCGIADPRWLSRFGNAARLADTYRRGRVLLAGDAAHIHFPAAGQGLNTGLQDAMNLGWRLAATVRGGAPAGLLDGYDAERRPAGRSVVDNTEVQGLLAELVLDERYRRPATALRAFVDDLLTVDAVNRRVAGRVSALSTAYPPAGPGGDPLVGRRMPDIGLTAAGSDAARVYELLTGGRFVLLDLTGGADGPAGDATGGRRDRVTAVTATRRDPHPELDGVAEVLIRPDGHVAWATRDTAPAARRAARAAALAAWTGAPHPGDGEPAAHTG